MRTATDLNRVRTYLKAIGNPQNHFKSILVAGSNGKGSTAHFLAAALRSANYRVGLFTSPHLRNETERISIDGHSISSDNLKASLAQIPSKGMSPFAKWTTAAFLEFARSAVDVAVLEVGLGGRLDPTNLVDPILSILTRIDLEHVQELGDNKEAILMEKLAIARPGKRLIVGPLPSALHKKACDVADRFKFEPRFFGIDFDEKTANIRNMQTRGRHQYINAQLALAAARELCTERFHIDLQDCTAAIAACRVPARFEIRPAMIIDMAHNDAAMQSLTDTLREKNIPVGNLCLAVPKGKRLDAGFRNLIGLAPQLVICDTIPGSKEQGYFMEAAALAREIAPLSPSVQAISSAKDALSYCMSTLPKLHVTVVAGSARLAGYAQAFGIPIERRKEFPLISSV